MKVKKVVPILLLACMMAPLGQGQGILEGVLTLLGEMSSQLIPDSTDEFTILPEYDFIVVGAGTAGCVIANRLTENPKWKVLLIEAGYIETPIMDFPILANYLQFTDANWRFNTMPSQRYCMGMENGQCNWPRGKVMGGSSVLNYMIYTRGNKKDYDNWAKLGNEGWTFDDVLPYFKKIENFTIDEYKDSEYHNTDGYLNIGYAPYHTKLSEALIEANKELGMKYVDYNGKSQIGVSYLQTSLKDGMRHSSNKAYIYPIKHRKNLHVIKMTMVKKILIDPKTKQTYGVEIIKNGRSSTVLSRKEVIVSAGAINSPQLLMLSGIGPKRHLQSLNIPVLKNSRVGFNLMDHIAVGGLTFTLEKPYSINADKMLEHNNLIDYLNYHKGPISIPGGCEALSFHDLTDPNNPDGHANIELLYVSGSIASDSLLRKNFGIREDLYQKIFKPIVDKHSFSIFPMLLLPKSKGRIMLSSADYRGKPLIFPNYFSDPEDLKTIVEATKLAINVTQQPAMMKIGTKLHTIPIPECEPLGFGTDEYLGCMAQHFTLTIYHLSGTCKMGPETDKRAVVDPRLRVHGIKGLRVIDASIMPEVISGHTNAPVYMIAEKGSDMIKQDWGYI